MKRNLVITIAIAAFMLASEVAWAADVSFSGQFRPRFVIDEDTTDNVTNTTAKVFDTRVRLNANANVNANTSVFLQFQSVGNWGQDGSGVTHNGTRVSQGGAGEQASDNLSDVGFHQAFVTLKNFKGWGFDAKIGRQEVVLDGHRLYGHTGWTTGAETKDAIRLTHSGGNHTINAIYIAGRNEQAIDTDDSRDENQLVFHANTAGVLGGSLSGYFVYTHDTSSTVELDDGMDWFTVGARQAGKLGALDYRVEYYHQFGDGQVPANALSGQAAALTDSSDGDRDAHLLGVRVGKTFTNVAMKPTITLWYDRLSGTDDDDIADADHGTFDTLSDTGHKFYGFMDFYLNSQHQGTQGLGLQDIAIKTKMSPAAGWTLKADMHWFHTAVDPGGSDADTFINNNTVFNDGTTPDGDLGSELDLTLVHKLDANTKLVMGYSHYWTSVSFGAANSGNLQGNNDDADWMYVMADTKF